MLSAGSPRSRSPSESTVATSVRTGPTTNMTSQVSHQSSIVEDDESVQQSSRSSSPASPPPPPPPPPPPFSSNFGNTTKSSTRSSVTPSSSTESTVKSGGSASRTNTGMGFRRPTPRRSTSNSESSGSQKKFNPTNKISTNNNSTIQNIVNRNLGGQTKGTNNNSSTVTPRTQVTNNTTKLSTFEKIDKKNGAATYLGTGTFAQLEDCIQNCLSKNKSSGYFPFPCATTSISSTHRSRTRASVLEDYSYEGLTTPREQINISSNKLHHYSQSYDRYSTSHHTKHALDLPLDEIRQVNDALAKYGIPVFSHIDQSNNLQNRPRPVGEILSACQQLLADPLLRSQQGNSVQHVWNNMVNHSPQTYTHGYSSPAVKSVASHLFGDPYQPPYNPVQSVASNIFNNPPQNSYYTAPPPPPPPPPSYPSYPSYPQQQQPPPSSGSGNAGQSVLARLFGRDRKSVV